MSQMTLGQALQQALEHHQAGRLPEAEALYRRVLGTQPNQPDALHLLGLLATQTGQLQPGIALMRQAVEIKPEFPAAWGNLMTALLHARQVDEAIAVGRQAVEKSKNLPEVHYLLAHALKQKQQYEEALAQYRRVLELNPSHADAPRALAALLRDLGRFEESIAAAQAAIDQRPDYVMGYNEIGSTLDAQGKFEEAAVMYRKALSSQPDFLSAQNNLAATLSHAGRLEEAIAAFRHAATLAPDRPEVHLNLGQALLRNGNLPEGFKELEWRWKPPGLAEIVARYPRPRWDGSNTNGRSILLTMEPSVGDTLQFVRYAPILSRQGAIVIVECMPELKSVISGMKDVDRVIAYGENPDLFELQCPLGSVPLALGTTLETIPNEVPYIQADAAAAQFWATRLAEDKNFKVGLVWAAASGQGIDRGSSIAFEQMKVLLETPGVTFYNLQSGQLPEEYHANSSKLVNLGGELQNFSDFAALMANLDLVICVDTPAAHLAGAMGKPVWLLLRYTPDWRWMLTRTDSPWYPTMRLFGQQEFNDWTGVMKQVASALAEKIAPAAPPKPRRRRAPAKPKEGPKSD